MKPFVNCSWLAACVAALLVPALPGAAFAQFGEKPQQNEPFAEKIPVGPPAPAQEKGLDDGVTGRELAGAARPPLAEGNRFDSIHYSPDGTLIAVAGPENFVTLWDVATGKKRGALSAFTTYMRDARFTADGQWVVGLDRAGTVSVWETATGRYLRSIQAKARAFTLTPAKQLVTTADKGRLDLWDLTTGKLVRELPEPSSGDFLSHPLVVSGDGRWLAFVGDEGKSVVVLDLATGKVRYRFREHKEPVQVLALSADGKQLASYAYHKDRRVLVWDLATGKLAQTIKRESGWVTYMTFSPAGKTLACGLDNGGGVTLYNPATGKQRCHLHGINVTVENLSFAPDGNTLAVIDNYDDKISLFSLRLSQQTRTLVSATEFRDTVASGNGAAFAVVEEKVGITVYEPAGGKKLRALPGDFRFVYALSGDGQRLVARGAEFNAERFAHDFATKKKLAWEFPRDASPFLFAADDRALLWGNAENLEIGIPGMPPHVLAGHRDNISELVLSADGKRAASGGRDGKVIVWDVAAGKLLWARDAHDGAVVAAAFSADGKYLATGGGANDGDICIWDAATGKELATLDGPAAAEVRVRGLAFAPDGRHLLTCYGGLYSTTQPILWDWTKRQAVQFLAGHTASPRGLFALGTQRVACYEDKRLLIWDWKDILALPPEPFPVREANAPLPASATFLRGVEGPRAWSGLAFSNDGKVLAYNAEKDVLIVDTATGKIRAEIKGFPDEVHGLLLTPDGKRVVTGCRDGNIKEWDAATGKEVRMVAMKESTFGGMEWALGGKALVVSGGSAFDSKGVVLLDLAGGGRKVLGAEAAKFAVSADGLLVAGAGREKILIWNAQTGQEVGQLTAEARNSALALSPDGKHLAVFGNALYRNNPVQVWDWKAGKLLHDFPTRTKRGIFDFGQKMFFSPSGQTLFTRVGGDVVLWDLGKDGRHRSLAGAHRLGVHSMTLTPDCRRLATVGAFDSDVKIWDATLLLDAAAQDALAPLLARGAAIAERDGVLTITVSVHGRKSGAALDAIKHLKRPVALVLQSSSNLLLSDLARLQAAGSLRSLDLQGAGSLSGEGLRQLAGHKSLEHLALPTVMSKLAPEDLERLKALPALKALTLRDAPFGEDTMKHVATLATLTELTLDRGVTPEEIARLSRLPKLRELTLYRRPIDGEWVAPLVSCKQLQRLRLVDCQVDEATLAKLKKAIPQVEVVK
jgi:WD40 repeat protein